MRQRRSKPLTGNTTITSRLLPELFEGFDPDDTLCVLDLGAGSAKTIAYLSQFRTKLAFVDLLDTSELLNFPALDPEQSKDEYFADAVALWQRNFAVAADQPFDICLFWDLLNFVSPLLLEALSTALSPHLTNGSRAYGFGNLHGNSDLVTQTYQILDGGHLSVAPIEDLEPAYAHSQQSLNDHLPAFKVARATLLQEGRLELLFTTN